MILMAAIAAVCVGSVAFYVRFLFALCKESRRHWISYLVRLEPESEYEEIAVYEEPAASDSMRRAA
jgi:hypothetical protein